MTDRTITTAEQIGNLRFGADGLLPVVAQDALAGRVLMVAWANAEALERTLSTGLLHFWSRSRGALWRKGETSGNTLRVRSLHSDCDADTILARVEPGGPACHTGETSCFGAGAAPALAALDDTICGRAEERPEGSYTTRLLADENLRLKKLGEEAAELVAALAKGDVDRIPEEAGDLVYHLMAAVTAGGGEWTDVLRVLEERSR